MIKHLLLSSSESNDDKTISDFTKHIQSIYGEETHQLICSIIDSAQELSDGAYTSKSNDRRSYKYQLLNNMVFEYSRYDRGRCDSGADALFINIHHIIDSGNNPDLDAPYVNAKTSSVLSFVDDFVERKLTVKIGKSVKVMREKMGLGNLDDKTFVEMLIHVMGEGFYKQKLIDSLSVN